MNVFLSLDLAVQDHLRAMGSVWNTQNPSATLMKRIRDSTGFVPMRPRGVPNPAWVQSRSYLTRTDAPREIVLFFRGQVNRLGENHEHVTSDTIDTLAENLESFATFVAAPLEAHGFKVVVFADLLDNADLEDPERLESVRTEMHKAFGSTFLEARVGNQLKGLDQLSSVISSWDILEHFLTVRNKFDMVEGVYMLRVDVKMLQMGLFDWPLDKLCFLWKTRWDISNTSVNDVLFYVPKDLFGAFSGALRDPPLGSFHPTESLHWLSDHITLEPHVWLEYDMHHPSNTKKEQNRRYEMTSRELGRLNAGKWTQADLEKDAGDSPAAWHAHSRTKHQRQTEWCRRVKTVLDEQLRQGEILTTTEFATLWSERWPTDAILWYKPETGLLKSMEQCRDVVRMGTKTVEWRQSLVLDHWHCCICGFDGESHWRPFWTCAYCECLVCVMCGHHSPTCANRFLCETCWDIPPWRTPEEPGKREHEACESEAHGTRKRARPWR